MNFKKIFSLAFASALLFTTSCSSDSSYEVEVPKGKYEDGILIANEGNFGTPNADFCLHGFVIGSTTNL
jgi:hypothetical protein